MFEKIKEYQFVILIGIAFWAALVYFILRYNTTKEWSDMLTAVQNSIVNSISKSQVYKKKYTIANLILQDLSGQSIGKYSINTASWVLYLNNYSGDLEVALGSTPATLPNSWPNKLYTILLPATAIGTITDAWWNADDLGWLVSDGYTDVNWWNKVSASSLTPAQKGYLVNLYFGFWNFANENDAKSFQKSYLSRADLIKDANGTYMIVQKIAQR